MTRQALLMRPLLPPSRASAAATCSSRVPAARTMRLQRRLIGEQAGLSAIRDKSTLLRRHDSQVGGTGETVVDSYASWGFTIGGVAVPGAVLLLPKASMIFEPRSLSSLTPASLSVLTLLGSPVRMLVIGCGHQSRRPSADVRAWCEERQMALEALPTQHACSTFNFMVAENRPVAAVLFPLGADSGA